SGSASFSDGTTLTVDNTALTTFSGAFSGGSLIKQGAGTLAFTGGQPTAFGPFIRVNAGTVALGKTGVNSFTAAFSIGDDIGGANADVVRLEASNQITDSGITVAVHNSGLLNLNGFNETLGSLSFFGGNVMTGAGTL